MLHQALQQHFGFNQFRNGQEAVVSAVMAGQSAAAIFPTGSGKSLCYQLPAVLLPNLTLVVSPLVALMQDQVEFLNRKGIAAAAIDSSLSKEQVTQLMQQVRLGQIKVLMVAVERLKNERFRNFINQVAISLLVIDEAHCISEWGHNFRPDYLKLPMYQQQFGIDQVLLLTATATPKVIEDMARKFNISAQNISVTGFYRSNLNLAVEAVSEKNKLLMLEQWLFHEARYKPIYQGDVRQKRDRSAIIDPTIIYVTLQQSAEQVAAELKRMGFNVKAYHAGMNSEDRQIIQTDFMAGNIDIIVATIAFGMGIDKANIRHVVHYDLPKSIENYSQEVGRAGRDGQASDCLVLANRDNLSVLENFVYGDTPERSCIEQVLECISQEHDNGIWSCQLIPLSNQVNIRQLPLKTLLVYLELEGVLQPMYAYFAEYKFKLLRPEQEIIAAFSGERQNFVQAIFHYSQAARTWWTVDLNQICQHYGSGQLAEDRARVIKALEYFDQQGYIELQAKQMTDVYRVTNWPSAIQPLASDLAQRFAEKQDTEIKRIHQMLELFAKEQCLSFQLADYFGDNQAPVHCGHCSACHGHKVVYPKPVEQAQLQAEQVKRLAQPFIHLYQQELGQSPTAILVTRFLLGLTAPVFTRLKARKLTEFACLEAYSYRQLLAMLALE